MMKTQSYVYILVSVILFFLVQQLKKNRDLTLEYIHSIQLIDTFSSTLHLDTASERKVAGYHPIFIGPPKRKMTLAYQFEIEDRYVDFSWGNYQRPQTDEIEIYVDNQGIIGSGKNIFIPPPPPPPPPGLDFHMPELPEHYRGEIRSYPVIIGNLSKDYLDIGFGGYLPLILEAKDSSGQWQPVQRKFTFSCGMGLGSIILPPNEVALSTCPLYQGDYQTRMRLAFWGLDDFIYSNEFVGWINYDQFTDKKRYY